MRVMGIAGLAPNEAGRHWITVPGTVTGHEMKRSSRLFGLVKETHYFVQVHLDDEAYEAAKSRLKVQYIDHTCMQIENDGKYEVKEQDLRGLYPVGQPVSLCYGTSSSVDQWFTGTEPLLWKLEPRVL